MIKTAINKKITNFFKSYIPWKGIIGTVIGTVIIGAITFVFGILKGLNYIDSFKWILNILNQKISTFWLLVGIVIFFILIRRAKSKLINEIKSLSSSIETFESKIAKMVDMQRVEQLEHSIDNKLDKSFFERFKREYDIRILKNHPYHGLSDYSDDKYSFIKMIREGNDQSDMEKIEMGIRGLTTELRDSNRIHGSDKNEIIQLLKKSSIDSDDHFKTDLENVLKETEVY